VSTLAAVTNTGNCPGVEAITAFSKSAHLTHLKESFSLLALMRGF